MADERIEDISSGELTTIAADDKLVILDKSDTTDDADGTAKYVELATIGALETNVSSADGDVTGAVGVLDVFDMVNMTADRDYILPTTAAVGDRAGIMISNGDDAFELDLHTVSASTDTINGVDSSVGTASWSRLFITGEVVIFRCIVANSAWIVEYDGRIPCSSKLYLAADTSSNLMASANTFYQIPVDTSSYDTGDVGRTADNDILVRRAGSWFCRSQYTSADSLADNEQVNCAIYKNNGGTLLSLGGVFVGGSTPGRVAVSDLLEFVAGDTIESWGRNVVSINIDVDGNGEFSTFFTAFEVIGQ